MSLFALTSGPLIADPVRREGAKGPLATAMLRAATGEGEAILVSLIAFGDDAARLLEYGKGDALAVSGRAQMKSWTGRDGAEKHGLGLVVEQIAALKPRPKPPGAANGAGRPSPRNAYARQRSPAQPAAANGAADLRPFDDRLDDIYAGAI